MLVPLVLASIRTGSPCSSISEKSIADFRDDEMQCGYCRCILGKCEVSNMQYQLKQLLRQIQIYNEQVSDLQERLTEIEEVTGATGTILVSAGQIGETAYYALFSNGHQDFVKIAVLDAVQNLLNIFLDMKQIVLRLKNSKNSGRFRVVLREKLALEEKIQSVESKLE